jgi:hypothetical protein
MNYGHGIAFDSTLIGHSLTRRAFVAGAIEPDSVMERWFTRDRIGIIVAWACAALYLTSRMPQIYKNVSVTFSIQCYANKYMIYYTH